MIAMTEEQFKSTEQEPPKGIPCPDCGCCYHRVRYTRQKNDRIERKRECRFCSRTFITRERVPK